MIKADKYYLESLAKILNDGNVDENPRPKYKDGKPAYSKYITQVFEEYDISKGEFPIPTLRNTAIKTGIKEIFWIYRDQTNSLDIAHNLGINWWDEWDIGDGTIGQRYGATINRYDLMNNLLIGLENDPFSRRHNINLLQEKDLIETNGLYPCAFETEWSVRKNGEVYFLDLFLNQRSNDYIIAGFINKIQYVSLGLMVVSHLRFTTGLNYQMGKFSHYVNNLHVYDRHMPAVYELLFKVPLEQQPFIRLNKDKHFYSHTIDDFEIIGTEGITKIKSELELAI